MFERVFALDGLLVVTKETRQRSRALKLSYSQKNVICFASGAVNRTLQAWITIAICRIKRQFKSMSICALGGAKIIFAGKGHTADTFDIYGQKGPNFMLSWEET